MECEPLGHNHLEREHLECEHPNPMEQQVMNCQKMWDPMLDAIHRMQEVDSDLSPNEQAVLTDLFKKECNTAEIYLALKSDPVWKAWIKRKLTQARSG